MKEKKVVLILTYDCSISFGDTETKLFFLKTPFDAPMYLFENSLKKPKIATKHYVKLQQLVFVQKSDVNVICFSEFFRFLQIAGGIFKSFFAVFPF